MSGWPLLIDREQAARALHVRPEDVDRLTESGDLCAVELLPGQPPLYRPEDLLDLIDRRARPAKGPVLA